MSYEEVIVPFDYMMYIPNLNISRYTSHEVRKENCILPVVDEPQRNYQELPSIVNGIVDEIFDGLPIEVLDDVDKSVLVANWIQKKMQFIDGKKSNVQGKKYICDEFIGNKSLTSDMLTAIKHNYGVCSAFSKLSVAVLNNPMVNC